MATHETDKSEPLSPVDLVNRQGKAKFTTKGAAVPDPAEENNQQAFEDNHARLK